VARGMTHRTRIDLVGRLGATRAEWWQPNAPTETVSAVSPWDWRLFSASIYVGRRDRPGLEKLVVKRLVRSRGSGFCGWGVAIRRCAGLPPRRKRAPTKALKVAFWPISGYRWRFGPSRATATIRKLRSSPGGRPV
jgi:hypothetical protein